MRSLCEVMGRYADERGEPQTGTRQKGMTLHAHLNPGLEKQLLEGLGTIVCAHSLSPSFN